MKKYIEIQNEVIKDFKINKDEITTIQKNSLTSTSNLFYEIGLILTNNVSQAEDFEDFLLQKYELNKNIINIE